MQQKMKMMVQRIEQLESEKTTDAAVVREAKQGSKAPSPPQSNPSGSGGLGNRCWSESDQCRPLIPMGPADGGGNCLHLRHHPSARCPC